MNNQIIFRVSQEADREVIRLYKQYNCNAVSVIVRWCIAEGLHKNKGNRQNLYDLVLDKDNQSRGYKSYSINLSDKFWELILAEYGREVNSYFRHKSDFILFLFLSGLPEVKSKIKRFNGNLSTTFNGQYDGSDVSEKRKEQIKESLKILNKACKGDKNGK